MKKGSKADRAYQRIIAGLFAMLHAMGVGAIRTWERRNRRARGYLRQICGRRSLRLADLLDCFEYAGIDAEDFLRQLEPRTGGSSAETPPWQPYREAVASFASRARVARSRSPYRHLALGLGNLDVAGPPLPVALTQGQEESLAILDAERYEDPKPVVAKAERICRRALAVGHGEMALRTAGLLASALRLCMCLDDAETLLWAAYQQAERLELDAVCGDLLQRMVYVAADRGDYELGLGLAKEAMALYIDLGDDVRLARTHVERGIMCFHLGRFRNAMRAFEVALRDLPPAERRYRYTIYIDSAFSHLALGERDQAARCLRDAEECLPPGSHNKGRLLWLRAVFAAHGGEASAEGLYRQAIETLGKAYPGDAALASMELVHLLLSQGRESEARALAARVRALAMTLREGTVVQEAAWQVAHLEQPTASRVHRILEQTVGERSCLIQLEKVIGRGVRPESKRG